MFPEVLIEVLGRRLDIDGPTSLQCQALPLLFEERDLVVKAASGYGKTLTLCLAAVLRAS